MVKNISIFCGAHEGTNPNYALEAKKITALLSKKGVDVVFGGGNVGIMKIISDGPENNIKQLTKLRIIELLKLNLTKIAQVVLYYENLSENENQIKAKPEIFFKLIISG